jgi:hypothetical protein
MFKEVKKTKRIVARHCLEAKAVMKTETTPMPAVQHEPSLKTHSMLFDLYLLDKVGCTKNESGTSKKLLRNQSDVLFQSKEVPRSAGRLRLNHRCFLS